MRVEVDVEMSDFDTSDLIEELESRVKYKNHKQEIEDFCRETLNISNNLLKGTLLDELKLELIENNIHKFTLDELEAFFKSKP